MNRSAQLCHGVICFLFLANTPFLFAAANDPVLVESISTTTQERNPSAPREISFRAPIEDNNDEGPPDGIESQYQLQLLQQEVQELRGLVEELTHEVSRLKQSGDERYLELDGRFQALLERESDVVPTERIVTPVAPVNASDSLPQESSSTETGSQSEKTLYDTSLELIRNRQYELAITQLQTVITQYPDGNYAANAYYWLGEVYAAKPEPDYEGARQALSQVITFFPDHRKVPDAAFKLGKVYHLMGDCARAGELLNQIISQYQGRSVAKLADTYLRTKMGDCTS